jgi:hypothetical protein
MHYTYDEVKTHIWEVIKDKTDFVYEPSSECDVCINRNDWEYDPEEFGDEPPTCNAHYDGDACRYFYADERGNSRTDYPACVVGNWFTYAEFTPQDLNVSNWEQLEGQGVKTIISKSAIALDDEAVEFLNYMQTHQDTGISWGNAYEMSIAKLEGTE